MIKTVFVALSLLALTACSQGVEQMTDRTAQPCGDKPNCVSTIDEREKFTLEPFTLKQGVTLEQVEEVAVTLPGAKRADKAADYLRIECTSRIMRFVDDLELKIDGQNLIVRSESRVGHSDFGVNRKRAEQLRSRLSEADLLSR
ncbi:DUF1499 domain-containing protein [Vibrio sp. WXL210]|uniref:DUF1499 domain-containing protein n=1 Tax=Vibrio sp. WXL210 TaxID=3450709 RepID=UPI003EC77862